MSQAPSELRLLAGANDGPGLAAHLNRFGPMPTVEGKRPERVARLHGLIESSGLLGRGGSGVPAVWKFDFLARTNKPVIVVNCMEGEPASSKDAVLATRAPHLVLDGAAILAEILHAARVVVAVADDADPTASAFAAAIDERRDWRTAEIERPPARYIAGEESALVNWLHRGASLPTFRPTKPSYVTIRGREALVHNAETLAQLALIARFGASWFREAGTTAHPGTSLVTVRGGVHQPGVLEWNPGGSLERLIDAAGGLTDGFGGALIGGYGGSFVGPQHLQATMSHEGLSALGATFGPGIVVVLPASQCPVAEMARLVRYMAGESAGQCGPCAFGLPALARDLELLASAKTSHVRVDQLHARMAEIDGRGACRHPDGVVRLLRSGLAHFDQHVASHQQRGACAAAQQPTVFPFPASRRPR